MKRGLLVLVGASLLSAQNFRDLASNTAHLASTVQFDKSVYLAGEVATVTLTLTNSTSGALQVLKPFTLDTGCIQQGRILSGGALENRTVEPHLCMQVDNGAPSVWFAAGEQRQLVLKSSDPTFDSSVPLMLENAVGLEAGTYTFRYAYHTDAAATYEVVVPTIEASASIRFADIEDEGTGEQQQAFRQAFALRWNGQSFICITQGQNTLVTPMPPSQGLTYSNWPGAYVRVETSNNPVVSMTLERDAQGDFVIGWTDSTGAQHAVTYPKDQAAQPLQ